MSAEKATRTNETSLAGEKTDHSGHRLRLKRQLNENGLMSFSPHEVVELMLYYCLPRRDVNELSHYLVKRFGGVTGLIKSQKEDLLNAGLSPNAARTLNAFCLCARAYMSPGEGESERISTRGERDHIIKRLKQNGKRTLILLSQADEVIFTSEIRGDTLKFTAERALFYDAAKAMLIAGAGREIGKDEALEIRNGLKIIDVNLSYAVNAETEEIL